MECRERSYGCGELEAILTQLVFATHEAACWHARRTSFTVGCSRVRSKSSGRWAAAEGGCYCVPDCWPRTPTGLRGQNDGSPRQRKERSE
jgi:hypothetical protein